MELSATNWIENKSAIGRFSRVSDVRNAGFQVRSGVDRQPAERLLGGGDAAETTELEHHQASDDCRVIFRSTTDVLRRRVQVLASQGRHFRARGPRLNQSINQSFICSR